MRRDVKAGMASVAAAVLAAGFVSVPAYGAPKPSPTSSARVTGADGDPTAVHREDNLPHPLGDQQDALRREAIADLLSGKSAPQQRNGSEVVKVKGNRWVEVKKKPAKVDPIFSILVEFGDQVNPLYGGDAGPKRNEIAEPDRVWNGDATDNNSTIWQENFNRQSYLDLMYSKKKESMASFYLDQSGGKYTVGGDVSDWVTVPYNEARYGSNNVVESEGEVYWPFVEDTAQAWYDSQLAAGKTKAQITEYLKQFDIWDRYDFDGDGNFNESDGYIDHFQAIHAGEGEEAGGGAQGEDAIWSHRWYAYPTRMGDTGPSYNERGGVPLGDSGIWIGDYTTEPENGGLGVFAHEFGHDLGLPDLYDTTNRAENGTGFWSLMSGGSWLNKGGDNIGSTPGYMGPWEKLTLGWLDYKVVNQGDGAKYEILGPAGDNDGLLPQAVVVNLPTARKYIEYNTPTSGQYEWWTGSADDLDIKLTRDLDLTGATTASLTTKAWYDIEEGYDFLFAQVSADGGESWIQVGDRIDANSGGWQDLSWDLSPWAGQSVKFRFRYYSDGGYHLAGAFLDDIKLLKNGAVAWSDDVESGDNGWTPAGWSRFGGTVDEQVPRFYIAENRQYIGYDKGLKVGPYNFGWSTTKPDWVERFPYQDGLLVWQVDYSQEDNNTSTHPGQGLVLPIDARPAPIAWPGTCAVTPYNPQGLCLLANRRQPFDATFGRQKTDALTLHRLGVPLAIPSKPGIPTFDDSDPNRYWSAANPTGSVKVAGTGTKIEVVLELGMPIGTSLIKVSTPRR
ncbi:immune inhibitor A domain-containing protein [Micromonospora sp. NPDC004704]